MFLKQQKEGYQISVRYKTFTNALSEDEKSKFLLDAFKSPKLYIDLIRKFDGHTIPTEFKTHLIRFHKIAENAASFAADIFIKNAKFCGVLTEHNILTYQSSVNKLVDIPNAEDEEKLNRVSGNNLNYQQGQANGQNFQEKPKEPLLLNEINNAVEKKITLSEGKFAYWKYPQTLNKKDIEIFRKEIEILELILP